MYKIHTLSPNAWNGIDQFLTGPLVQQMIKAIEAGAGVDAESFTGGRALQYENLDATLAAVTLAEEDATLWRALPKETIKATVDQYNRQTGLGSEWGYDVGESESPEVDMSEIARAFATVKFYRDKREVSDIAMMVNMTEDPENREEVNGATRLVHRVDNDLYFGEPDCFPKRIKGFFSYAHDALGTDDPSGQVSIYNWGGKIMDSRKPFEQLAARVRNRGGRITHAFCNPLIQADFSAVYETAERIQIVDVNDPKARLFVGAQIGGIRTAQGPIYWEGDPFCLIGWKCPEQAQGTAPSAPSEVTPVAAGSGGHIPAGDYYYKVTAVKSTGESVAATTAAVTVGTGQKVTLTIASSDNTVSGFRIYRSAKDAGSAADCRYLYCCGKSGATTEWVDDGRWVPGTAHVVCADLRPNARALQWSQLMPLSKKPLAQVGFTRPFGLTLAGCLRLAKPEWNAVMVNLLPRYIHDEEGWDPLGLG